MAAFKTTGSSADASLSVFLQGAILQKGNIRDVRVSPGVQIDY